MAKQGRPVRHVRFACIPLWGRLILVPYPLICPLRPSRPVFLQVWALRWIFVIFYLRGCNACGSTLVFSRFNPTPSTMSASLRSVFLCTDFWEACLNGIHKCIGLIIKHFASPFHFMLKLIIKPLQHLNGEYQSLGFFFWHVVLTFANYFLTEG